MPTNLGTRATILALKSTGKTTAEVAGLLELSDRTVNDIYARAIKRGFDPVKRPIQIDDAFIADAPRSGRPKKQSPELQENVLAKPRRLRYFSADYMESSQSCWPKKDETDSEAWIDTEDEE